MAAKTRTRRGNKLQGAARGHQEVDCTLLLFLCPVISALKKKKKFIGMHVVHRGAGEGKSCRNKEPRTGSRRGTKVGRRKVFVHRDRFTGCQKKKQEEEEETTRTRVRRSFVSIEMDRATYTFFIILFRVTLCILAARKLHNF